MRPCLIGWWRQTKVAALAGLTSGLLAGGGCKPAKPASLVAAVPPSQSSPAARPGLTALRADGRFFASEAGTFRPRFASALALLTKPPAVRAAVLDELAGLGFNGVRIFAGALTWAAQTPELARARLPEVLTEAAARGLYVMVVANTDSATGYDVVSHTRAVAAACAVVPSCVLELANEVGHPTQSGMVNDPAQLRSLGRTVVPPGLLWTIGAALGQDAAIDGRYPTEGGGFNTAHLARAGGRWQQVLRLREIATLGEATGRPVMSGEPIGAAEAAIPGRRESDAGFFFAMGALCRGFELGCVWHSESGLRGEPLGPVQRRAAEAFVDGWRALEADTRWSFKDAGETDSPVAAVDGTRVVRAWSFVEGRRGFTVLVGMTGDPALRWADGWSERGEIPARPGVRVLGISR